MRIPLRTRLRWMPDHVYDRFDGRVPDWILYGNWADWWFVFLCLVFGHAPIPDQCNMPAHDACAWCRKPMPGQAERSLDPRR